MQFKLLHFGQKKLDNISRSRLFILTIRWVKRAMNFPNRARILIIKFNELQALFICKTINYYIIDQTEEVKQRKKRAGAVLTCVAKKIRAKKSPIIFQWCL